MNQEGNLIVNYLPASYREAELYELFVRYGSLIKVKVIYHKNTEDSMTYGFVRFQNPNDAIVAMSELNGREICGKRIKVGFARPGLDTINCKLYVKRVPPSYGLDDVHKLFSQFGEILESRLLTDAKGHSRQVAFVQYTNRQDAENAIMNLSGVIPPGGSLALIVKYATHPRQTQQHGYNNNNNKNKLPADLEYNFYAQLDMMNLQYPSTPSPTPIVPSQHHHQSHSNASTGYTPPLSISGKVDQFLQTKPRSSDWIDSYAKPHSPPTLISPTPPLPPPLTTSSTYPTFVTMSGVPPSLDIMDFHFLSKYGKVIDGKMMTRDIQVILPDGNPMNYQTSSGIIEFFVNVNSFQSFNHLLSLNDSMVVVEGHSIMVHVSRAR